MEMNLVSLDAIVLLALPVIGSHSATQFIVSGMKVSVHLSVLIAKMFAEYVISV